MQKYRHLTDYLHAHAENLGEKPALITDERSLSWQELWNEVDALAAKINCRLGSGKQQIVSLVMSNGWEFIVSYLAILHSGHIASPIDVIFKPLEIEAVLRQIPSKLIIADEANKSRVSPDLGLLTLKELSLLDSAAGPLLRHDPAKQIATLLFTSGTTGRPKAATHTHANHVWNIDVCSRVWQWNHNDSLLISLRLSHVYGLAMVLAGAIYHGNTFYLQDRFDAKKTLQELASGKITMFNQVADAYARLTEIEGDYDLSKVRLCISGGAPLPPAIWQKFKNRFGQEIVECYGSTETGRIASNLLNERIPGSPGRLLPEVKLKIGKNGELMVSSPGVFPGYWHNAQLNKRCRDSEGYWRTDDLGELVDDRLVLKGRLQERIRRQGYSVSPRDVEWAMLTNPAIKDIAVLGVQRPNEANDQLAYFLTTELTDDQVDQFCKQSLPSVWRPDRLIKLDHIPKTRSGKANIHALRAML